MTDRQMDLIKALVENPDVLQDPDVAKAIVADRKANLAISRARQQHDIERQAVAEVKDPARRRARRYSEQRDAFYQIVKFRNWALRNAEVWQAWEWTDELREEARDAIEGLRLALDGLAVAPDFESKLEGMLDDRGKDTTNRGDT